MHLHLLMDWFRFWIWARNFRCWFLKMFLKKVKSLSMCPLMTISKLPVLLVLTSPFFHGWCISYETYTTDRLKSIGFKRWRGLKCLEQVSFLNRSVVSVQELHLVFSQQDWNSFLLQCNIYAYTIAVFNSNLSDTMLLILVLKVLTTYRQHPIQNDISLLPS